MDRHFKISLIKCLLYGIAGALLLKVSFGAGILFVIAAVLGIVEELV